MTGNVQIEPANVEHFCAAPNDSMDAPSDRQQLAQEIGCLRVIVAELLMKNQNLRWALQRQGSN